MQELNDVAHAKGGHARAVIVVAVACHADAGGARDRNRNGDGFRDGDAGVGKRRLRRRGERNQPCLPAGHADYAADLGGRERHTDNVSEQHSAEKNL